MFVQRSALALSVLGVWLASVNAQPFQKQLPKNAPPLQKQVPEIIKAKSTNLDVTAFEIKHVAEDQYRLEATVKNVGRTDHPAVGQLIFSRAGHGEPLPGKPGGKVDSGEKWGHERIGTRDLPAIKAGQSITLSHNVRGKGDFYVHIQAMFENTPNNNRMDKSNLTSVNMTINNEFIQSWFGPNIEKSKARLHGRNGTIEIPGLLPVTTFDLPTEAFDKNILGVRFKLDLKIDDVNSKLAKIKLEDGTLIYDLEFETRGDEIVIGGNKLADSIWPDINAEPFKLKIKLPLKFNERKQLFEIEKSIVTVNAVWKVGVTNVPGLHSVAETYSLAVNHNVAQLLEKELKPHLDDIAWNLNRKLREQFLTDKQGHTGAIDSVKISGDKIEMKVRTPKF